MKVLSTKKDGFNNIKQILEPIPFDQASDISLIVKNIISDVQKQGDKVLLELGHKFDSDKLTSLKVTESEIDEAYDNIDADLLNAIKKAKSNIYDFHSKQLQKSWFDTHEGFIYGQVIKPIETVGFYAPGGLAPYPSTVLMTAVPGIVAGVKRLVMMAPAQRDTGNIHPAMLVAAKECGVSDIFKAGGAQAIAAMAFGTQTIPKVDKIVGPGNAFVAEAKRQLYGYVGIDQIAGPSEILVICDESATPSYVAADMLSQAEHATDSRCIVLTTSDDLSKEILKEIDIQTQNAKRRDMIEQSLMSNGIIVVCENIKEACDLSNVFSPEHLELQTKEPWDTLKLIKNAGTIMLGYYTPVPICDFAAGPNHTLPTMGTARFSSALSVDDYIKKSGLLSFTKDGLSDIANTGITIAEAEGFEAHANTIKIRL